MFPDAGLLSKEFSDIKPVGDLSVSPSLHLNKHFVQWMYLTFSQVTVTCGYKSSLQLEDKPVFFSKSDSHLGC